MTTKAGMKTEPKPKKKYRHYQKHESPNPMRLRHEAQRRLVSRLLMLGWSGEKIARRLGVSPRSIRYLISTAAFQQFFDTYQSEYFQRVDARLRGLLDHAISALHRQLRSDNWQAVDSACEKVLRIHGKYLERLELTHRVSVDGHVAHTTTSPFGILPEDLMSDAVRQKTRELLELVQKPRALPPKRLQSQSSDSNGHETS